MTEVFVLIGVVVSALCVVATVMIGFLWICDKITERTRDE